MAKEDLIEMQGKIDEVLPDTRYRVTLENGHQLIPTVAEKCASTASKCWQVTASHSKCRLTT